MIIHVQQISPFPMQSATFNIGPARYPVNTAGGPRQCGIWFTSTLFFPYFIAPHSYITPGSGRGLVPEGLH